MKALARTSNLEEFAKSYARFRFESREFFKVDIWMWQMIFLPHFRIANPVGIRKIS